MIDQKAREMTAHEAFIAVTAYDSGREAGIIEGRRQAFEEAAKVADEQAINRQRVIDRLPEGHRNRY